LNDTQRRTYDTLYRQYEEEQFVAVLEQSESLINQFSGDEIVSKFEFFESQWKIERLGSYKRHYSLWWIITQIQKRVKKHKTF
jgi:hypothetical protein